ncbi:MULTISPECIES: DUF397 domain-containing protein [unclassified Streptomyces]|uniref:DUF397 domain-containing protein n=1 Tax=unclassified Streptomyces TaxID=2593676 RepID=UPI0022B6460A|nr:MULTISPECIES: DUF397 domain-containing protein [unclassified Streptomyces]MCZ7417111.1 DUF397 domain-containing protein [Streptomyces sp. WMMC897]MCZ7433061.1 DUF397 domain-containing protein [Streptomyces sp. WMMC1477]
MAQFEFRKSSYSGGQPDSQCVEVAVNVPAVVAVRDSKAVDGPALHLSPEAWAAFVALTRHPGAA